MLGAGGLGSPQRSISLRPASVPSESSTWTSSMHRIFSARSCTTRPRRSSARWIPRKIALTSMNPDIEVNTYDVRLGADNIVELFSNTTCCRTETGQLPYPIPRQRRIADHNTPVVHGSIFRFEGQ